MGGRSRVQKNWISQPFYESHRPIFSVIFKYNYDLQEGIPGTRKKKYGRCSDTTTNNTQDTIRTTLIYLMQPYDTSNSYILFSTAFLSPE